ncbi:MAG: hypothetical protein U1F55_01210 [Chitinivorax sp.]
MELTGTDGCGIDLMAAIVVAHIGFNIVEAAPVFETGALQFIRAEAEKAVHQYDWIVVGGEGLASADQCRQGQCHAGP